VSNGKILVEWDKTGSIVKLVDSAGFNYAGKFNNQGLNSYWYVPGLDPKNALTNGPVQIKFIDRGPVVVTVAMISDAPGSKSLERRVSLYAGSDMVFIENIVDKKSVREKESVHFGFPFNQSMMKTTLDAGYGTMRHLEDQLPGSDMDYLYGRRWIDVSNLERGVQWMFLETPLVEPGNMIDERRIINQSHKEWKTKGEPSSTWFSYVMNNYWHTNYKADQNGISHYHYALKVHNTTVQSSIEKTASEFSEPLVAFQVKENERRNEGLFELTNDNIVVTSVTPSENGFIVRLFNPETSLQQTFFRWKSLGPSRIVDMSSGNAIEKNNL
jgi:hypothetical protein